MQLTGATVTYGSTPGITGIDLRIDAGTFLAVTGASAECLFVFAERIEAQFDRLRSPRHGQADGRDYHFGMPP